MRKISLLLLFTVLLISLIGACQSNPPPQPLPASVIIPNLLVAFDGQVLLQRDGQTAYSNIGFGTQLNQGDSLKIDTSAIVLCGDDLKPVFLDDSDNILSIPCTLKSGNLGDNYAEGEDGYDYQIPRAQINSDIPYIQQPRGSFLLNPRPVIRWHDTGAGPYRLRLADIDETIWESDQPIMGTEFQYPIDAPALISERSYRFVVTDDNDRHSDEEDLSNIGFKLISPVEQNKIKVYQTRLAKLNGLDDPARDFALATYYAQWQLPPNPEWGLLSDAILLLEKVASTKPAPAVYLQQGDVYLQMKLYHEAELAYNTALKQAEANTDLDAQTTIYGKLWRLTQDAAHCQAVIERYTDLGDQPKRQAWCDRCGVKLTACP
ncbi:hypothetical protein QUF58_06365 [Anaerolineales bacterium HSG24]|nr:hypothetical protein [Anaerolineales bacterium HSG24]